MHRTEIFEFVSSKKERRIDVKVDRTQYLILSQYGENDPQTQKQKAKIDK